MGSRAITGALLREGMLANMDRNGMTLREVLHMHGFDGSDGGVGAIAMDPGSVRGCASQCFGDWLFPSISFVSC